jgi:hypothetical protein
MGGSDEGVYKHSTGDSWASDIGRPGKWDWDRPHPVCTGYTSAAQVGYIIVLTDTDMKKSVCHILFCPVHM